MSCCDSCECECITEEELLALKAERDRLKAELEEYKFQTKHAVNMWKQKAERLAEALKKAVMRLGSPTMDYAPSIKLREVEESNEEASRVLLKAFAEYQEQEQEGK